ncbi:alpha/beta hydrolase [Shimwellia pseudoproteus]|uniref:alpha/beta hydrolase n=1 Tax=Shimwellia pseudoproteus TaxID=570012 RepID=UPI0018ED5D48|nr:alpha/beta hydrolase [Shimwellia pseudoproteus]MBJ3816100.1 alpha/beta hydrolase [Shimwellia pseudoproteus]
MTSTFTLDYHGQPLRGEHTPGQRGNVLMIHGGSKSRRALEKYQHLFHHLAFGTTAFDCLGHGESGGTLEDSSLASRTDQARTVADYIAGCGAPVTACMGVSMGAYNALQLSATRPLRGLLLMVPGVYTHTASRVPFGPEFSTLIRQPRSWQHSDAWQLASCYTGNLLVVAGEQDDVIPAEIPPRLYQAATRASHRQLWTVPGADHHSIWQQISRSPERVRQAQDRFIRCLSGA